MEILKLYYIPIKHYKLEGIRISFFEALFQHYAFLSTTTYNLKIFSFYFENLFEKYKSPCRKWKYSLGSLISILIYNLY